MNNSLNMIANRPLASHRLGQTDLTQIVQNVVNQVIEAAMPALKDAVANAAQAAEPTIQKVVDESVMPKVVLGIVVGMVGVAGVSALIGSLFASSGRSSAKKLSGLSGLRSIRTNNEDLAAGSGSSSGLKGQGGFTMAPTSVNSPPIRAKAANGNLVHELRQSARELADELARKRAGQANLAAHYPAYRPSYSGYRPGYVPMNPSTGLGAMRLVNGEVKAGAVVLGAVVAVPVQQLASKVLLQQALGANEMVGDGVTGLAGILLHLVARSSFTLGFGTSLLLPFVADLTNWALVKVGAVKTGAAAMSGARPQNRIGQTVTPQRPTQSVAAMRQRLTAGAQKVA